MVQLETPEEGQRTYRLKHCEYNYKDEDNNLKILNDKNQSYSYHLALPLLVVLCLLLIGSVLLMYKCSKFHTKHPKFIGIGIVNQKSTSNYELNILVCQVNCLI